MGTSAPQTAISDDGTPIAYWPSGSGPPLVMVHGAPADHSGWARLLPYLEPTVTACPVDRRGRGASGDGPGYAHAREYEDVAAVVDAIGGPVDLLGHSFGGPLALEAALLTANVRRLVLYEAWLCEYSPYAAGLLERLEALAEAGDNEGVLMLMLREAAELTDEEIAALQAQASWPDRIVAAGVYGGREARAESDYRFAPERFAEVDIPILLLVGSESPGHVHESVRALNAGLPNSRIVVLEGQGHAAHHTAPSVLADEVLRFLAEER